MIKLSYEDFVDNKKVTWDGRQRYIKELMDRVSLVLDSKKSNPLDWLENLNDFFDIASFGLDSSEVNMYLEKLMYIEDNIEDSNVFNDMRELLRQLGKSLWVMGIIMPEYSKKDPNKAVMDLE